MPGPVIEGVRHLCFDKDGTLIDVHRYWCHTSVLRAHAIGAHLHLSTKLEQGLLDAMGVEAGTKRLKPKGPVGYAPRAEVIAAMVRYLEERAVAISAEAIGEVLKRVDADQQARNDYCIEPLAGLRDTLARLHARGVTLTVYSSDRRENCARVLALIGVADLVERIVGGNDVQRGKPDPEGFLASCEAVQITPRESAYVGDTIDDLLMAKRGGAARGIGIATGLCTYSELRSHSQYVVETLAELAG